MIDLDVMLAAFGKPDKPDKKVKAINLIREVKVAGWDIEYFQKKIHGFYARYSKEIITAKRLEESLFSLKKEIRTLLNSLVSVGVKEEDAVLAIISSTFAIELKTFNKKHLLNKKAEINKIFREEDMNEIKINEP